MKWIDKACEYVFPAIELFCSVVGAMVFIALMFMVLDYFFK